MYTITHNGRVLFDPRLQGYPVDKPKLTREANTLDALSFTLYPTHPEYGLLEKKSSILNLYRDGTLLAQFAPTYHGKTFNGGIEYKCKNIICFLDDFYYRPLTYSGTVSAFFDAIIEAYNARVTSAYQVTKGNVHSADIEYETSDPKTYLEALKTVTDTLGGYIFPRFASGNIYLDYLQDSDLSVLTQKIMFGENMTDLFIERDSDNCFSVLYPFGTDENNQVVSISSVNGGLDYLENDSAVAAYGRREKMMTWTNVETPSALLSLAQAHLSEIAAQFYESVRLSAVDLHNADADIPSLDIYMLVDCVSVPHGYSHRYPITSIDIPLDAPQSESITLGMKPLSMTDRFSLERKTNASARSSFGRSLTRTNAEVESHWQHITDVTDQGMSDCFGIIGVAIDETTHLPIKRDGEYIWAEEEPGYTGPAADLWGHFHRTAWDTMIGNMVTDHQSGNLLSQASINMDGSGNLLINAINTQGDGTATINANRIAIQSTSGSGITLDNQGNISINAGEAVSRINNQTGTVQYINAGMIHLNGSTIVTGDDNGLIAPEGWFTDLYAGSNGGQFTVEDDDIRAYSKIYAEGGIDALDGATITASNGVFYSLSIGDDDVSGAIFDLRIVAPAQGSDTYTLQKKSFSDSDWENVGTFSRATTLSGAWSSGEYTVTASPQGNTESTQIYLGATGNGSFNFSVNTYHDSIDAANIAISDYIYLTEEVAAKTVSAHWHNAQGTVYGVISTQATYNAGWGAARTSVGNFPESTPQTLTDSITVKKPSATVDGTAADYTYTLDVDNSYVYLKNGINPVARISNPAFANGKTAHTATSAGTVTLTSSDTGSSVSKNTTVTYSNGDTTANVPITIDASAVYTAGRNSVTISNSDIVRDGADDYNSSTHNTTIYIEATASNGAQGTQSFVVSGEDAYNAGHDSVTGSEIDLSGRSAQGSALDKSNGEIKGAIWFQKSNGTWESLRDFTISYPQTTHDITCTSTVSSIGTDRGQRTKAGEISKSGLVANSYLGFTISCGGTSKQFYITVNT